MSIPKPNLTWIAYLLLASAGVSIYFAARLDRGLVVDEPVRRVGELRQGDSAEVEFVFRNEGFEPITGLDIKSSCACTVASLPTNTIQPGESLPVRAKFSAGSSRGLRHAVLLAIYKLGDKQRITQLKVVADIRPDYDISVEQLEFPAGGGTARIDLTCRLAESIAIKSIESSSKAFVGTVAPLDSPRKASADVTFDPANYKRPSKYSQPPYLLLHTDNAAQPTVRVPLLVKEGV
jgi:hypothetical protein